MTTNKDYSISFARMVAMVFIVTCHFMQYFDCMLAWWLNVGVQMFLFISGYLYGKKKQINAADFYIKSGMKILLDYYIYAIAITAVMLISGKVTLNKLQIAEFFLLKTWLPGVEHFWFIPCILVCYALTPILIQICDRLEEKNTGKFLFGSAVVFIVADVVFHVILKGQNSVWINCYIFGMLFSRFEKRGFKWIQFVLLLIITVLLNGVQIYIDYFTGIKFTDLFGEIYSQFSSYAHAALGITLVVCLRWSYANLLNNWNWLHKLLHYSDKISYDVYITHQFFILGPHSLLALPLAGALTIPLTLACVLGSAIILHLLSQACSRKR